MRVQLTGGTLRVDTTTIASDKPQRDNRLRSEGLQTDQFPTATFTLTQPVDIPAAALAGTASDITLVGDLTLHGVTKSVSIPAQAQLVNGQIQVAGQHHLPALRLLDHGPEHRRLHRLDRRLRARSNSPVNFTKADRRRGLCTDSPPTTAARYFV